MEVVEDFGGGGSGKLEVVTDLRGGGGGGGSVKTGGPSIEGTAIGEGRSECESGVEVDEVLGGRGIADNEEGLGKDAGRLSGNGGP